MAAGCIGAFGTYKYTGSRYRPEPELPELSIDETVWVTKRYIPTDLRMWAPVPRHKLIAQDVKQLPAPDEHWIPPKSATPWNFSREHEETRKFVSTPSTRCEEWSTLRQMLPSRGSSGRVRPPNWGTGYSQPPYMTQLSQRSFPHINSPMTR